MIKMMTRFKSFCLGIIVTSLTWIVAIYLFGKLNESSSDLKHASLVLPAVPSGSNYVPKIIKYSNEMKDNFLNVRKYHDILGEKLKQNKEPHVSNLKQTDLTRILTKADQEKKIEGYKKYSFNTLVSDRIGYHRSIPDVRNSQCKDVQFSYPLPRVSIIICFYNEAISALLRTIHSILSRTSEILLEEILLIDDFSDMDGISESARQFSEKFSNKSIYYHRTTVREGLIRARLYGASLSKGEVLVFLDSHCEVNVNWLEPLLEPILSNQNVVTIPIIDMISPDDFKYTSSPLVRGGFNWGLHFKWDNVPKTLLESQSDLIKPIKTPTMAGGLFAINREYFFQMGSYDRGMDVWGGENIELSFRIWMCGGQLEIIPCSRVGHIFRSRRPYGNSKEDTFYIRNSLRVALVWLDSFIEKFYDIYPTAKEMNVGDIKERIALKNELKCHDFKWYLDNVYPEILEKEKKDKTAQKSAFQEISMKKNRQFLNDLMLQLSGTNLCIQSERPITAKGSLLVLEKCNDMMKTQIWSQTSYGELMLAKRLCLESSLKGAMLAKCHFSKGNQDWTLKDKKNTTVYNVPAGLCLGTNKAQRGHFVTMIICSEKSNIYWDQVIV